MKKLKVALSNFASLLGQDFINLLHLFDGYGKDDQVNTYAKELRETGIIRIDNFLPRELCDQIAQQIETITSQHNGSTELSSGAYLNFRNENKSGGSDKGMVDIFNIDYAIDDIGDIDFSLVEDILEVTTKQKIVHYRKNAYVNRGVKGTRGYHVDNVQPVLFKAFVYLTDVPDLSYGPYSFVKRSHRFSRSVYYNIFRNLFVSSANNTDMPVYDENQVYSAIGKKGSLIISNQNAIHRGMPQEEGKTRIVLILNYMVLSKLSYLHKSAKENLKNKPRLAPV
ncbi:MAG: hypothetical protein AAGG75_04525 [Bacteroidota bacterium]